MKKITIYLLSSLLTVSLFAAKDISAGTTGGFTSDKTSVGTCNPSSTQVDLDINNIRARLLGGGDFWWDGVNNAQYEYPKIDQTTGELSKNVLFAGALWFTGYGDDNQLRCSAQTFRNQGHDFWTGPLEIGGEIPDEICSNFDEHFVVYGEEISQFIADFDANGSGSLPEALIPDNIKFWPGKGNVLLENHPTNSKWYFDEGALAPFFDADGNGVYNPVNGDYPVIKLDSSGTEGYFADQMIFWVINDNGNTHGRTNGTAIGVQVNCLAFAFQTSDELNDMTFYTYEIFKKTAGDLNESFMGVFVDPDLGFAGDDFVGCDTVRSLGFCYTSNNSDNIYGPGPPIVGMDYFEGPLDDDGNELGMSSFCYFVNSGPPSLSDPDDAQEFRFLQEGLTTTGDPLTNGDIGTTPGNTPIKYAFPGNPADVATGWSECEAGNTAGDRRFVQNSGPFTLKSSQSQRISVGVMVVGTDPNTYNGCPDIEAEMGIADDKAQFLFDNNFGIIDGPDAPNLKIREMSKQLAINLINEPSSNNFGENYTIEASGAGSAIDSAYNFEGYLVYQLRDNKVTAKDLSDPAKAKIILQSDIKNGISNVFNYVKDNVSNIYAPEVKVQGADDGIKRSFLVTEDVFADGESELVNYKTYYFAVVAYAYNNFIQFDPLDPNKDKSQLAQYLQGRRNFNTYSAIPHDVESEVGGTKLNAEYGQGVLVKRLEGKGNGGKELDLTQNSIDAILTSNFEDIIEYEPLFDPVGVKVIDPLSIQNVDFELSIKNDSSISVTDSSYWELKVLKEGQTVETIRSVRLLDRPYEQILEDYGISLNVGKPLPIYANLENGENVYDYLNSDITFDDESKKWLSFVSDESNGGALSPSNWIRSGSFENTSFLSEVYDSHRYDHLGNTTFYDENEVFTNIVGGGFAPYCLTANYKKEQVVPGPDPGISTPNSVYGPAFLWDVYDTPAGDVCFNPINTLDKLQSVNIVLTSNKELWSKCIVFETGEDNNATVGNSNKGQIRNQASVDKDGNETGVDNGYSYFPGYAFNKETGERMMIAFGESSDRTDNNGGDMIWNPTSKLYDELTDIPGNPETRVPVFGGKHFIYVFETRYDQCATMHSILTNPANYNNLSIPTEVEDLYKEIMYTSNAYLNSEFDLLSLEDDLIPNDVSIKIRVERPYEVMTTNQIGNNGLPRYGFSTLGLAPEFNVSDVAESVLDNIRVVPNPYYAYSSYEVSPNSNVVKITNLPDVCEVSIYTLDGKLVKKFDRAVGNGGSSESVRQDLSLGQVSGISNLNNSLDWNLKNHKDIPVSSGTYMIYVNAPGVGETVVKSAVFVRPPDVTNF
ncbi:MAG: hypothetical protein ACPG4Y_01160 [Chitinophagales bacterium]